MGAEVPDGAALPPGLLGQMKTSPEVRDQVRAQVPGMRERLTALSDAAAEAGSGTETDPWPALRRQLESAALIEAERIPGVGPPFIRFHPTLAPLLWAELDGDAQAELTLAHRQRYYQLARFLYHADEKNPDQARAIARREPPNPLDAVDRALAAGDEDAVDFINSINWFLKVFGRTREAEAPTRRVEQAGGAVGSDAWYTWPGRIGASGCWNRVRWHRRSSASSRSWMHCARRQAIA